jgi:hypothetical protein
MRPKPQFRNSFLDRQRIGSERIPTNLEFLPQEMFNFGKPDGATSPVAEVLDPWVWKVGSGEVRVSDSWRFRTTTNSLLVERLSGTVWVQEDGWS